MPHYRSREIWDETRKEDASFTSYIRAILYELQPIRFSTLNIQEITQTIKETCIQLFKLIVLFLKALCNFSKKISLNDLKYFVTVVGYVFVVLYIHRLFDAGLIVIISTILILIFTIGLGDNNANNGTSAYSVFNRGFQQLLGSIDVDSFVNQYAGGGLAIAAGAGQQQHHVDNNLREDNMIVEDEDNVHQRQNNGTSRKSGKKARRNIEQRREIQRQRQLARDYEIMGDVDGVDQEHLMLQAAEWEE